MSIRTFTRVLAAALAAVPASVLLALFRPEAGLWPLLAGPVLLALLLAWLAWVAGGAATSRWQLRYHLEPGAGEELARLEGVLHYLADRAGHTVVEAGVEGLSLVAPRALDQYIQVQLARALPEAKVTRVEEEQGHNNNSSRGTCYLFSGSLASAPLAHEAFTWAMGDAGRRVRLHLHRGPYATLTAETDGTPPPGPCLRVPVPRPLLGLWHNLPLWDELSAGVELSSLFPPAGPDAAHSSRSHLFRLAPPAGYQPDEGGRVLGRTTDGRLLTLDYTLPLLTIGAPPGYLAAQAVADLRRGCAVVALSPRRRTLERIARQAGRPATCWIDQDHSLAAATAHLAIAAREEWPALDLETVAAATRDFLANAGVDPTLPAHREVVEPLVQVLAASAQLTGHDFLFVDLYAVSQSVQALRAFLGDLQEHFGEGGEPSILSPVRQLQALLDDDAGYIQAVAALAQVRSHLEPLKAGPLHNLSRPPFANLYAALSEGGLVLVPMTNADFPRHNHLLGSMVDLVLSRTLAAAPGLRLALYLDEPRACRDDLGQRWLARAREEENLALVLNAQAGDLLAYGTGPHGPPGGKLIFRCPEAQAQSLVRAWDLPCSSADLAELPNGAALAILPGLLAALQIAQGDQ